MPRSAPERRILFVDDSGQLGDSQLALMDIAVAHRDRGAVVLFDDGPFAAGLVSRNVALLPVGLGRTARYANQTRRSAALTSARMAFSLARIARSYGVLYANSPAAFLVAAAAGFVARRPVVWHLREFLSAPRLGALHIRTLITSANTSAARVVASSRAVADAFVAAGGRRELVEVIRDGIDVTRFERIGPDVRGEVRRTLELSERAYVVGSFGSADSAERSALAEALTLVPDVEAVVVDGGIGDHPELLRLIAACDVVVHTGNATRLALKVLLSQRPLIAVDVPGIRELIEDGVTGIVVAPGDAGALAAAIRDLRDEPIRSDEMAFAGAADARRRFSSERMNASITRVVDDVSSHSKQSHDR